MSISACCATATIAHYFGITLEPQESIIQVQKIIGWNMKFFGVIGMVVVIAPIIEEFIFRYLLWKLPDARNFWIGTLPSSLIFVAAHYVEMKWPNDAFVGLFVFAVAQCWLYHKTQRLIYPILNHALFNLTNIIMLIIAA